MRPDPALAAQAQLLDDRGVTALIGVLEVVQQPAALGHHLQKATTRVVVLLVGLEVLGQVGDPFRQDRDLDLGAARIVGGALVFANKLGLAFNRNLHRVITPDRGEKLGLGTIVPPASHRAPPTCPHSSPKPPATR